MSLFLNSIIIKINKKNNGDNNFSVFKSLNDEIILVYSSLKNSINFLDIEKDKLIKIVKYSHESKITNFRYIRDKIIPRDLLLSVSDIIKNIKIWDINDYKSILNIENVYLDDFIFSSCFIIDEFE